MNLRNLSVGRKLWLLVLGLMLTMLVLLGGLLAYLVQVDDEAARIVQANEDRLSLALRWRGMSELAVERGLVGVSVGDVELSERLLRQSAEGIKAMSAVRQQIEQQAFSPEDRAQLQRVEQLRKPVLELNGEAGRLRANGEFDGVQKLVTDRLMPAIERYVGAQEEFAKLQERQRDAAKQDGQRLRQRALWLGILVALVVVGVGVVLSGLLVRSLTQPLERAVGLADAIASGDLTRDVHDSRGDELGQLLRALSAMGARLRDMVGQVRTGVEAMSGVSSEIASGNSDLSARTEQTAANLQQTAASMEQLTATVTQSADTARQANQLVAHAAQSAEQGGRVVGQAVSSMQQITDSSRRIADIIGVIDSIAFQTNILALNAAVEAARAGEQGRGFAVVAAEVRQLAQRSAEAAKEIKQLIATSVDNVQTGSTQVEQAGQSMLDIVQGVRRVSDLIGEITASSAEQRDGIAQVNQAMANLDQMTQQNAALVEQASAAASAMHEQSRSLALLVSAFNVGQAGAAAPAPAPAARRPAAVAAGAQRPASLGKAGARPATAAPARPGAAPAARIAAPARPSQPPAAGAQDDWESF